MKRWSCVVTKSLESNEGGVVCILHRAIIILYVMTEATIPKQARTPIIDPNQAKPCTTLIKGYIRETAMSQTVVTS